MLHLIKRKPVLKNKKEDKQQKYSTSVIVAADTDGKVIETLHILNKPGEEAQTHMASSMQEAMEIAE